MDANRIAESEAGWEIYHKRAVDAAAKEMREIAALLDPEDAHPKADKLMCEILRRHGYGEAVDVFEAMDKWYA